MRIKWPDSRGYPGCPLCRHCEKLRVRLNSAPWLIKNTPQRCLVSPPVPLTSWLPRQMTSRLSSPSASALCQECPPLSCGSPVATRVPKKREKKRGCTFVVWGCFYPVKVVRWMSESPGVALSRRGGAKPGTRSRQRVHAAGLDGRSPARGCSSWGGLGQHLRPGADLRSSDGTPEQRGAGAERNASRGRGAERRLTDRWGVQCGGGVREQREQQARAQPPTPPCTRPPTRLHHGGGHAHGRGSCMRGNKKERHGPEPSLCCLHRPSETSETHWWNVGRAAHLSSTLYSHLNSKI